MKEESKNPLDFQNIVTNAVAAERAEQLKTSPQLTLGELILKLEAIEPKTRDKEDKTVRFDFGYFQPTNIDSWRGSYCELALGYSEEEKKEKTVTQLIKELKGAIGKTYTGYKGGDFVMGKTTPIWVSNYGECPDVAIVNILDLGWQVILETKYCEY